MFYDFVSDSFLNNADIIMSKNMSNSVCEVKHLFLLGLGLLWGLLYCTMTCLRQHDADKSKIRFNRAEHLFVALCGNGQ